MRSTQGLSRRRPRGPAAVHAAAMVILLVIVAAFALKAAPAAPPAIAEFAPQPQKQIKDAPVEQGSVVGRGKTGNGVSTPTPPATPTPTPPPLGGPIPPPTPQINVAAVKHCVGNPPRQIEDPQSPPCVNYWVGDNGGATYNGVTASTITVGVPMSQSVDQYLTAFFNDRFEFYGRKINLVDLSFNGSTPAQEQADAAKVAGQHIFASTEYGGSGGYVYQQALAQHGIISVNQRPQFTSADLAQYRPYIYQYAMPVDQEEADVGQWACGRLVGGKAIHAGDITLHSKDRRFGIITSGDSAGAPITADPLVRELAACGVADSQISHFDYNGQSYYAPSSAQSAVARMKQDGVTTVFCVCQGVGMGIISSTASRQQYTPEWVGFTYLYSDEDAIPGTFMPPAERSGLMGLSFIPKQVVLQDDPARAPIYAENPGAADPASTTYYQAQEQYRVLLLIASGIQMAGPNLTPQTFEQGLQKALFPNPDTPIFAGHVGFAGGSHSMTIDGAEIWWSNTARSPYRDAQANGAYCYVDHGARHRYGEFGKGPDPIGGACDSGSVA